MASAILARRNEPHWAETKVYMRKPHPSSNPNPNPNPNKPGPNANPNPNPNFAPIAGDHATDCDDALPSSTAAFSDDSSSFNRKKAAGPGHRGDYGGYITFNISTYSKKELRDLKRRLESELEQVRSLVSRIESREIQSSARSIGHSASGVYGGGGGREVTSSAGLHHPDAMGSDGFVERPAAYRAGQYCHQPPEISTPKDRKKAFGGARPLVSPRGPKRLAVAPESEKALAGLMSKCRQILTKLMKHKGSIWFNKPVDVEGMKLHDYNTIIKNPMDLGTVRTKLTKGNYPSPVEFAADIRLTFNNALLYNPAGHVVNVLAGQLLHLFEDEFCSVYEKYVNQQSDDIVRAEGGGKQRSSTWARAAPVADHASSTWARAAPMVDHAMNYEPVPTISPPQSVPTPALAPNPLPVSPVVQQQQTIIGRPVMVRLPKPKAKEPNKRPMTIEEKGKLTQALQSLPPEKMDHVLQIVRKRNGDLVQHDDEIELDFEVMDTETLWELDRFVGNCKKMMSKIKRQEAMANDMMISGPLDSAPAEAGDKSPPMAMDMAGETPDGTAAKRIKKADPGDEDVDIGEEMLPANYPPVEIEKDNAAGCASNSSSSGSDSSSSSGSSGSDSDSSSGSDSDDDANNNNNNKGRSPAGGLRRSPSN